MSAGLTRQALRRHRWSLLGPAATQSLAATVISALLMTLWSLDAAPLTAARLTALDRAGVRGELDVFLGDAVYLSILIVGVTMNLAITRQARDIALLRSVGATPGQLRRSIAAQAAAVAVPAAVTGYVLSLGLGRGWVGLLVAHQVLPAAVRFRVSVWPLPMVVGIAVGTSVLGALVAAIRPARQRPAAALADAATGRPRPGVLRTLLGVVLFAAGAVLSVLISHLSARDANNAALFVLLSMCTGVGLLGPVLMRLVGRLAGPLARAIDGRGHAGGGEPSAGGRGAGGRGAGEPGADGSRRGATARLALDGVVAFSRPLSGALVPLVLSIAFATVITAMDTTPPHVTGAAGDGATTWLDYSGSAMVCGFAAVAAVNALMTIMAGRARDLAVLRLVGATRRRVVLLVAAEATVVTMTALVLAALVALATVAPTLQTSLGTWQPYLPPGLVAVGVLVAGAVVAAGLVAPAVVFTRARPAEIVASAAR